MNKKIERLIFLLGSLILSSFLIGTAISFTPPTQQPPGGNVPPPIHVGTTPQEFSGSKLLKMGASATGVLMIEGGFYTRGIGIFENQLGIGTASPAAPLHVVKDLPSGSGWPRMARFYDPNMTSTDRMLIHLGQSDSSKNTAEIGFVYIGPGSTSNRLTLGTHGSPQTMVITAGGYVGIGTESPGYKLSVFGQGHFSRDNTVECCSPVDPVPGSGLRDFTLSLAEHTRNRDGSINTGRRATIQFHNGWEAEGFIRLAAGSGSQPSGVPGSQNITDRRFIFGSYQTPMAGEFTGNLYIGGNVGIGTTNLDKRLKVQGVVWAHGYECSSDVRLKENLTELVDVLSKLDQIKVYQFKWNEVAKKEHNLEGQDYGLLAQEVEKVFPDLVITDSNGYKSVKVDRLIYILLEAIKEQQQEIDQLKARVEALENK